jgi:alpha-glucosidase (family GH31 glycosyl hydrolase)
VRVSPGVPSGRITVRATASRPDADAVGVAFKAASGERYLGFGERSNAVDQTGNEVQNYVAEGPYQPNESVIVNATVPAWGHVERRDSTYFPIPWLLSTNGYGVLVENDETSWFRLGSEERDAWSLEAEATTLEFSFFGGPKPADALKRMTLATGRQPAPQAPWFFGPWAHTGQENSPPADRERGFVQTLRRADAPVSAVETHMRYLPCGVAVGKDAQERARADFFHGQGLPMITYFNSEICRDYSAAFDEAARLGVLQKRADGTPYVFDAYVGDRTPPQTPVGQIDFTHPNAQGFYDSLLDKAVANGADGWMEDFGEYTPLDSVSANGQTGKTMHNAYPVPYHCAGWDYARRAPRPIARHIRSGWTGVAPCAQVVWGGDPTTDWGFDGLDSAIKNGLSMGLSGISIWGSDTGGFFSLSEGKKLTAELLRRWIQFGAVSGVMRTKWAGPALPANLPRAQISDREVLPTWRRYAKLRTQLYPYLAAADREYRSSGLPIMRHLALVFPEDARASAREDEFMFGPDLLAAPVVKPGASTKRVYLPRGRWIDLWRSASFDERSGGLELDRARVLSGGRSVTLRAPIDELPLLARSGTLLALTPRDVDTLSDYGRGARDLVRLADRAGSMELLAFPRGETARDFAAGRDRLLSSESSGWTLRIRAARSRNYALQASFADLSAGAFTPCAVTLDGKPVSRKAWKYDRRARVFRADFRAPRAATLVARRC